MHDQTASLGFQRMVIEVRGLQSNLQLFCKLGLRFEDFMNDP